MKGKIHSWNHEKGFGFIEVENSKRRVFAHISDFNQQYPLPKIGETVSFDLFSNQERDGKFSAKNIVYLQRTIPRSRKRRKNRVESKLVEREGGLSFGTVISAILTAVICGGIVYQGYQIFKPKQKDTV